MTALEKILKAKNMVEISNIILSDVYYEFCILFKKEYRGFDRKKESQESWTKDMLNIYDEKIKQQRIELFNHIDQKFHKSIMYKKLHKRIITN